jgi:ribonuclease HI
MRRAPAEARGAAPAAAAFLVECDGASSGNPGPAGIGVRLARGSGETVAELSESIGSATNNVAEYTALIRALELAAAHGARAVAIRMDSELVVKQVRGEYKTREAHLRELLAVVEGRLRAFDAWSLEAVRRGKNRRADALAKAGVEKKGGGRRE